jgi:hypothetical protein
MRSARRAASCELRVATAAAASRSKASLVCDEWRDGESGNNGNLA